MQVVCLQRDLKRDLGSAEAGSQLVQAPASPLLELLS
jgi:hypothetical protein